MTAAPGPQQPDEVRRRVYYVGCLHPAWPDPMRMSTPERAREWLDEGRERFPQIYVQKVTEIIEPFPAAPSAQPDEVRSAVMDEQGRICRCDGGAYEIRRHPFLVHPDCAIHGTPAQSDPRDGLPLKSEWFS